VVVIVGRGFIYLDVQKVLGLEHAEAMGGFLEALNRIE
jgi:hypothetical protein